MFSRSQRSTLFATLLFACATAIAAQTNDEIGAAIELEFSSPGARSLGLGGALLALADDATAAYTNPAGLLQLHRPEVSLEARFAEFESRYVDGGSANGTPTGSAATSADGSNVDAFPDLRVGSSRDAVAGLSFVSFTLPRRDWALALFRHELTRYAATIERSSGFFFSTPGSGGQEVRRRAAPISATLDLVIEDWGLSGAYRLSDRFWIGATAQAYRLRFDAVTHRFRGRTADGATIFSDGPSIYSNANEFDRHLQSSSATAWSGAVSFLWSSADRRHRVAGILRPGPSLPFDYTFEFGPAAVAEGVAGDPDEQLEARRRSGRGKFRIPDSWGVGWVYQPRTDWIVSVEGRQVRSSELAPRANILKDVRFAAGEPLGCCPGVELPDEGYNAENDSLQLFRVDDSYELRVGVEWARPSGRGAVLALRAGAWGESEHQVRYDGANPRLAGRYLESDDTLHGSLGAGWTVPVGTDRSSALGVSSLTFDVGVDRSPRRTIASGSVVVRF